MKAGAIILPGVGAFGEAMLNLRRLDLIFPIKDFVDSGKFLMGICLGMQLLLSESEEFGNHKGLGIIEGRIVRFPARNKNGQRIKVPHIGWRQIYRTETEAENAWMKTPLSGTSDNDFMYFIHSYYALPARQDLILSVTTYGGTEFCSAIGWKNVFAFQFHPEKSGANGINIYHNLKSLIESGGK
jgi:glutamine amidotransferase